MMSSAATDGFQGLSQQRDRGDQHHPEDHARSSEEEEEEEDRQVRRGNKTSFSIRSSRREHHDDDDDDEDDDYRYTGSMAGGRSKYQVNVPSTVYDANTGPKGVIADAQSYERARKNSRRPTCFGSVSGWASSRASPVSDANSEKARGSSADEEDEDEEDFMQKWRATRIEELKQQRNRPPSASGGRRQHGTLETVDADGFLNALENTNQHQIVVVCIYDPDSYKSSLVEDCLRTIARTSTATRFVRLHHHIADMQHVSVPAILAYKGGDVYATIDDIFSQIPDGRPCSSASLAELLKLYQII